MSASQPQPSRDPQGIWPTSARALFRDAWVFFTLLVLLVTVFFILWPLQLIDRAVGTRIVRRLIDIIERVGNL